MNSCLDQLRQLKEKSEKQSREKVNNDSTDAEMADKATTSTHQDQVEQNDGGLVNNNTDTAPKRHEIVELQVFSGKMSKQPMTSKTWDKIMNNLEEYVDEQQINIVVEKCGFAKDHGYILIPDNFVKQYKRFVASLTDDVRAWERNERELISFRLRGLLVKKLEGPELVKVIKKRNKIPGELTVKKYHKVKGENYTLVVELDEKAAEHIREVVTKAGTEKPSLIVGIYKTPFRYVGIKSAEDEELSMDE